MGWIREAIEAYGSCIISEDSLLSAVLVPKMLDALEELAPEAYQQAMVPGAGFGMVPSHALEDRDDEWWQSEECDHVSECLFDALDEAAPEGFRFGTQEGDAACFGFWKEDEEP